MDQILRNSKWSLDKNCLLSEFLERYKLPRFALITKGQYSTIGVPNAAHPNLNPYVLVYNTRMVRKLSGRVLKWKDDKIVGSTNQRVLITDHFEGYFEILSEDGRPMKQVESVTELVELFPDTCLVRLAFKAYLPDADGELRSTNRMRTVKEGELLTLVGFLNYKNNSFLRCFDESGKSVYLRINGQSTKCKFSPVVKKESAIMGAHKASSLMMKRLPITVRLIRGNVAPNLTFNGHLVVKLEKRSSEVDIFLYNVFGKCKKDRLLSIIFNANLMLSPISGQSRLQNHTDFRNLLHTCSGLLENHYDRILPFDSLTAQYIVRSNHSSLYENDSIENDADHRSSSTINYGIDDEEIDQIYDYVRRSGPMPAQLSSIHNDQAHTYYKLQTSKTPVLRQPIPGRKHRISPEGIKGTSGPLHYYEQVNGYDKPSYWKYKNNENQLNRCKRFSKSTDKLAVKKADMYIYDNDDFTTGRSKIRHEQSTDLEPRPNSACLNQEFYESDLIHDAPPLNKISANENSFYPVYNLSDDRRRSRFNVHNGKQSRPYKSCNNLLEIQVDHNKDALSRDSRSQIREKNLMKRRY